MTNIAHDNKENIEGNPQKPTTNTKPKSATKKQTKTKAKVGKQRTPALSHAASATTGSLSNSAEPEEQAAEQQNKKNTKKRLRKDAAEGESSASEEKPKPKRSRLREATTKKALETAERHAEWRANPEEPFPPEDHEVVNGMMEEEVLRKIKLAQDKKDDFKDIMVNAVWDSGKSSNKRWQNQSRCLAFVKVGDGRMYVADRRKHGSDPSKFWYLEADIAIHHLLRQLEDIATERREEEERLTKQYEKYARAVNQKMAQVVKDFPKFGKDGVRIVEDRFHCLKDGSLPASGPLPVAESAESNAFHTSFPVNPSNQAQEPTSIQEVQPVTPSRGPSRFTTFVNSVTRPLSRWAPSFSRGTTSAESQTPLAAQGTSTTRSLNVTAASANVTARDQSKENDETYLPPVFPTPYFPDEPNADSHQEADQSPPPSPVEDVLANARLGPLEIPASQINWNRKIDPQVLPDPDLTALAFAPHEGGDSQTTTEEFRKNSLKFTVEHYIVREVKIQVHAKTAHLKREYDNKTYETVKRAKTKAKAQFDARIKELEHKYAKKAEEEIAAARREVYSQLASARKTPHPNFYKDDAWKNKPRKRPRIGDATLPLTADGLIPGPKNGGYGMNDDYFESIDSDEDSQISDREAERRASKQPAQSIESAEDDALKRRKVAFAEEQVASTPATSTRGQVTSQSGFEPKSVLKKTSKYAATVQDADENGSPIQPSNEYKSLLDKANWPPGLVSPQSSTFGLSYTSESDPEPTGLSENSQQKEAPEQLVPQEPAPVAKEPAAEPTKDTRQAAVEAEKAAEAIRRMKEKAEFIRDEKFRPKTPSKLREADPISSSPVGVSVTDVVSKFSGDDDDDMFLFMAE